MTAKQKRMLIRIAVAAALYAGLVAAPLSAGAEAAAAVGIYLFIGYDVLLRAGRGVVRGAVTDEHLLVSLAGLGALALAWCRGSADYCEAVAVMLFYRVGEWFQRCAVEKSRRSIAELMDICPESARLVGEEGFVEVAPEDVPPGSIIEVRPGERVPLDGEVVAGCSLLNTAALTGESRPRRVAPGACVVSGCINGDGTLTVRTTKPYGESTVARVLELVEDATARKSRSEQFITRFARLYTPAVIAGALALALLPPLGLALAGAAPEWSTWIYRALIFLVISCPCALVLSVPLGFFAAMGGAGRMGVLIKGANYIETLARVRCAAFDKTGTLTQGALAVVEVQSQAMPRAEFIELAAHAECVSAHPIGKCLAAAYGREPDRRRVSEMRELPGRGVSAVVDGRAVAVGSGRLMAELGLSVPLCSGGRAAVYMAVDGALAGYAVVADALKPHAAEALRQLRSLGVRQLVLVSGDAQPVADAVADALGMDAACGELLPADKVAVAERLAAAPDSKPLLFVGDGINDAPVLARADVGIAMGAFGSDAAIEAADVVLMHDDPLHIPAAIRLARKCMRIVRMNIVLSLVIKFACLALGALGLANMWMAIFADVGVMILAVLNSARALWGGRVAARDMERSPVAG